MEQARYWMWAKRKPDYNPNPHVNLPSSMNSYVDSWEEQAFAEDAAGTLGGCVWPPRSYSCSFCRREFRSAQALGGHMNVHRRDRARLKQSPANIPPTHEVVPHQNHALNPCTSPFDASLYPSQMSTTFLYENTNPENSGPELVRVSSPPTKVGSTADKISSINNTLCFFSPLVQKDDKGKIVVSSHIQPSWSSFVAEKRDRCVLDSIKNVEIKKLDISDLDSNKAEKEDCVTDDLSTNLNLVFCQGQTNASSDEEVASCKRRKIETRVIASSLFPNLRAVERFDLCQSEPLKLCSGSAEEGLDLELRLGDAPKRDLSEVEVREEHMGVSDVCF